MDAITTKNEKTVGKPLPYFAFSALFFIFVAASVCAIQIPLFRFRVDNAMWNNPILFFTLFALSILFGGAFVFFAKKLLDVKINRFLLVLFSLFAIGGIVGALCHGDFFSFTAKLGTLIIDDTNFLVRLESICSTILIAFSLYVLFGICPYTRKCKVSGFLIAEALIVCAAVLLFYSLITEWGEYIKALNDGMFSVEITSILGQKNVYAYYLLLGMFAEIFLLELTQHRWRYLMMALFVLAIVFTGSKAAILMAGVTFAVYLIYRLVRTKKEGTFAWKNAVIPLVIIGIGLLFLVLILIKKPNFFASLWEAFVSFFQNGQGSNVNSRLAIWKSSVELVNQGPVYWIFGHGDLIFPYLISVAMDVPAPGSAHNAVLEILGRGGVLRVILFITFFVYIGRAYVKRAKESFKDYFMVLVMAIVMLGRAVIESAFVFDATYTTLAYCYVILMPILSPNQDAKADKPEVVHFDKAYWKGVAMRYVNVLLALLVAGVALLIPRPYGWIVAVALVVLSFACAGALYIKRQGKISNWFIALVAFAIANAALIPLAFLERDPLFVTATLAAPAFTCLAVDLFLYTLYPEEGNNIEAWEYLYGLGLYRLDSRNRAVIG